MCSELTLLALRVICRSLENRSEISADRALASGQREDKAETSLLPPRPALFAY